jgi:hypothetical protein
MTSKTGFYALPPAALALVAAGLMFAPIAHAQTQSPAAPSLTTPSPSTPPSPSPSNIPDKKLDAAAAAARKVVALSDEYEQKIAKAPEADKQRLAGEAQQATIKAVSDEGLSIDEYATIMKTAQNDPAVRDKLIKRLK